jgi:hypothetical protein
MDMTRAVQTLGKYICVTGCSMRLSSVVLLRDDDDDMYTLLVSFIFIILHCKDSLS